MILIWLTIYVLVFVMLALGVLVNKKMSRDREKGSSFECGLDPLNFSSTLFSKRFFVIALIFLIFKVEITLPLPMVFLNMSHLSTCLIIFFSFILVTKSNILSMCNSSS